MTNRFCYSLGIQSLFAQKDVPGAVRRKTAAQAQTKTGRGRFVFRQTFQYPRSHASDAEMFLQCDQELGIASRLEDGGNIQGRGESQVDDATVDALFSKDDRGIQGRAHHGKTLGRKC